MVRRPVGDADFFVTGVLQGDTFVPFLSIIFQDYLLRTSTKKNFLRKTKKKKGQETNDISKKLWYAQIW